MHPSGGLWRGRCSGPGKGAGGGGRLEMERPREPGLSRGVGVIKGGTSGEPRGVRRFSGTVEREDPGLRSGRKRSRTVSLGGGEDSSWRGLGEFRLLLSADHPGPEGQTSPSGLRPLSLQSSVGIQDTLSIHLRHRNTEFPVRRRAQSSAPRTMDDRGGLRRHLRSR